MSETESKPKCVICGHQGPRPDPQTGVNVEHIHKMIFTFPDGEPETRLDNYCCCFNCFMKYLRMFTEEMIGTWLGKDKVPDWGELKRKRIDYVG